MSLVTVVWLNFEATVLYRLPYPSPDEKCSSKCSFTWCDSSRSFSERQIKGAWKRLRLYRETERWAQNKITMRQPHSSHLLLIYIVVAIGLLKQKKTESGFAQFHFISAVSDIHPSRWKHFFMGANSALERLQGKHQGRNCSCGQLVILAPSLWLIQQDQVQNVCTQFCSFGNQMNTSPHNLLNAAGIF